MRLERDGKTLEWLDKFLHQPIQHLLKDWRSEALSFPCSQSLTLHLFLSLSLVEPRPFPHTSQNLQLQSVCHLFSSHTSLCFSSNTRPFPLQGLCTCWSAWKTLRVFILLLSCLILSFLIICFYPHFQSIKAYKMVCGSSGGLSAYFCLHFPHWEMGEVQIKCLQCA